LYLSTDFEPANVPQLGSFGEPVTNILLDFAKKTKTNQ
jgi:hypothetical protein